MIRLFQRLLLFSGLQKKRLIRSFLAYLVSSFFEMIPIMAILTVLTGILKQLSGDVMPESTIWISLGIMIVSIVGRIVFVNLSANARTLGSFAFGSEKRMEIGERLKRAPMGYFNENRLGDITAAVTTTLGDLEQMSVTIMENVAGGFIHAIVIGVWLMIYEWRIGLISLAGLAVALIVYSFIGKVGRKYAPRRQAAQAGLVTAVLEYVQGMGVVKAFGLAERTGKAVDAAIEESKEANIVLEKAFSKMTALYQTVFKLARAAILVFAPYLLAGGSITPEKCLLLLVSSFMIYAAVEVAGSMSSIARAVEASLDRLDNIMDIPSLDENGADLVPENFNIEVKNMSFGYGEKEVLHQISLNVPQGSSCAIVGPSGAGKTTLVGLIARFWDVKEGQITLGGRDVREYTSGSLLKNFAMSGKTNPFFVKDALSAEDILDELMGHDHGEEKDEHVWLSLKNAQTLCVTLADALCAIDPDNKNTYIANAAAYRDKLAALDADYKAAVEGATHKTVLFGDRFPFRYLVDDYGLRYYAAFAGCSAETEASFETVSFLAKKVDELGLPCVLTIEGAQHRIAETIVQNTVGKNQKVLTMDSMQSTTSKDVASGATYLSVMEKNLSVLKEALG